MTHFSATKGQEANWKCVCADINVRVLGMWKGYEAGLQRTMSKFHDEEKVMLLNDTWKVVTNVQDLCHDLNQLCIRRDRIYSELQNMGIKVDAFKRFDTFYYKARDESECVHKKSSKT